MTALWFSRFSRCDQFGLYEDDIYRVGWSFDAPVTSVLEHFTRNLTLEGQGRPLHEIFIFDLSWLAAKIGDLSTVYVVGYLAVCLNIVLFSFLLKRLYPDPLFVTLGTLCYALYPTDTSQAFLTHSLGLQPSLTMLLLGVHAFLSHRYWLAYPLAVIGCVLCYEPVFPLFLAVPLLRTEFSKRQWSGHFLLCLTPALAIFAYRHQLGSSRLAELPDNPILSSAWNLSVGPLVNLKTLVTRPLGLLPELERFEIPGLLGWALLFSLVVRFVQRSSARTQVPVPPPRITHFAVAALFLAYPIMLAVDAQAVHGRNSRVHFAAIVGAVLTQTLVLNWLIQKMRNEGKPIFCGVLGCYFALLLGFGWQVQSDYINEQALQKRTWSEVFRLAPDYEIGDLLLIEGLDTVRYHGSDPPHIGGLAWAMTIVPDVLLLKKPGESGHVLSVEGFESHLEVDWENFDVFCKAQTYRFEKGVRRPADHLILLRKTPSGWTRLDSLTIGGKQLAVKPKPKSWSQPNFREGILLNLYVSSSLHSSAPRR